MTRFIMSLDEAVDLVLFAFEHGINGDILVQKAPACTIETLAKAVTELFGPETEIKTIGIKKAMNRHQLFMKMDVLGGDLDEPVWCSLPFEVIP